MFDERGHTAALVGGVRAGRPRPPPPKSVTERTHTNTRPPACAKCGEPLRAGDRFCRTCGASVGATPAPSYSGAATPPDSPWDPVLRKLRAATAGEFVIQRELGRGGMAAVFLAHEIALNRRVAVKVMSPSLMMGEGMVQRFKQEAITVANLSHPHIITIHAVRNVDDLHFFVMKFVEGASLEHVLTRTGALSIQIVRMILQQVGGALAYAHRRGVIHRDVKPANILIDTDGNAVVTDFGIAKVAESTSHTQTGTMIGTPAYMSPEQCHAGRVSAASDQYSLGVVAYQLICGRPAFTGTTFDVLRAHIEDPVPPLRELRPSCPPELEAAVIRMLAKNPADRWPSIAHAMAAIGGVPTETSELIRERLAQLAVADDTAEGAQAALDAAGSPPPWRQTPAPPPSGPAAVDVTPPGALEVGDRKVLRATARDTTGGALSADGVRWESTDPGIVAVDERAGTLTAVAPGTAEVIALLNGVRAQVSVSVAPPAVASVSTTLPPEGVHVGEQVQLSATVRDKHGGHLQRPVVWTTTDPSIASVSSDGVLTARAPGSVKVTAECDGKAASQTIIILEPRVVAGRAAGRLAGAAAGAGGTGASVPPRRAPRWAWALPVVVVGAATWAALRGIGAGGGDAPVDSVGSRSADTATGTGPVPGASGGAGQTDLGSTMAAAPPATAATGGTAATGASAAAARLVVTAPGRPILPGDTFALTLARSGGREPPREVRWSSSDPAIITVDPRSGLAVARRAGATTVTAVTAVTATADARRGSARVVVQAPPAAAPGVPGVVVVEPEALLEGDTLTLEARLTGVGGGAQARRPVEWTSGNADVARVDRLSGQVTAVSPGVALVTARAGGASTTVAVTVLARRAASVRTVPARASVVSGERLTLKATVADVRGGELRDRRVTWSSSDPEVASVDPASGSVAAGRPGRAIIYARADGASGSSALTVTPKPAPEPSKSAAAPEGYETPPPGAARGAVPPVALVNEAVRAYVAALGAHDQQRIASLYQATTAVDRKNLRNLLALVRSGTARLTATAGRVFEPEAVPNGAAATFQARLSWKTPFGASRGETVAFRARFERAGGEWQMTACTIVGPADLD